MALLKPLGEYVNYGSLARVFGRPEPADYTDAVQLVLLKTYAEQNNIAVSRVQRLKRSMRNLCRFAKGCKIFDSTSSICNGGGGSYCGRFRTLLAEKKSGGN